MAYSRNSSSAQTTRTVCDPAMCSGCMACMEICPKNAITITDSVEHLDASIDADRCIGCNLCHDVCHELHPVTLEKTIECWQGWADPEVRSNSSSGGLATAIMQAFVERGGLVSSCKFIDGKFRFVLAHSYEELSGFSGSKYAKSNPDKIYRLIQAELRQGQRVLFIGLPCQVSALKNFIGRFNHGQLLRELHSIDLICHGTPSMKLLHQGIREYGFDLDEARDVKFRNDIHMGISVDGNMLEPPGCLDPYLLGFLSGLFYTRNCFFCHYATEERVGDLTLGDSWGTDMADELPKGVSLALVQTGKGSALLKMGKLHLFDVDYANAVAHNAQLHSPTELTGRRDVFFKRYHRTGSVKKAVFAALPTASMKAKAKRILSQIHSRSA